MGDLEGLLRYEPKMATHSELGRSRSEPDPIADRSHYLTFLAGDTPVAV